MTRNLQLQYVYTCIKCKGTVGYLRLYALVTEQLLHPLRPRLAHPHAHDPFQLGIHLKKRFAGPRVSIFSLALFYMSVQQRGDQILLHASPTSRHVRLSTSLCVRRLLPWHIQLLQQRTDWRFEIVTFATHNTRSFWLES